MWPERLDEIDNAERREREMTDGERAPYVFNPVIRLRERITAARPVSFSTIADHGPQTIACEIARAERDRGARLRRGERGHRFDGVSTKTHCRNATKRRTLQFFIGCDERGHWLITLSAKMSRIAARPPEARQPRPRSR